MIYLLLLVLLGNVLANAFLQQYQKALWRRVHVEIVVLVLTASGFLVVLSLFMLFESVEKGQSSNEREINLFYGALLMLVISLLTFGRVFVKRMNS